MCLHHAADPGEWRDAARALLLAGMSPEEVEWSQGGADLFGAAPTEIPPPGESAAPSSVPRRFLDLADAVLCHSDPGRFSLLYRTLWRLRDDPLLIGFLPDPDVQRLHRMEKSVRRDCHKMTAFVRFREIAGQPGDRRRFVAWFEPDHHVVARTAPFFARRFADMNWMILTPKGSAALEDGQLALSEKPAVRPDLSDGTEALWRTYYASIFNPARLKVKAMQAEMPKKYWKNLPEASLIPALVADAGQRAADMVHRQGELAAPAFHDRLAARRPAIREPAQIGAAGVMATDIDELREHAAACTRCPLHCNATRTVFGDGASRADLMIVGEQPGDIEDLTGRPFTGPAGQLLDRTLAELGIEREKLWLTNAVKHFKFVARGKKRIHQSPNRGDIDHCRWWLKREIELVRPKLILALGATAVESLTGKRASVTALRGQLVDTLFGVRALVTWHPAYLLRLPDPARARGAAELFRQDIDKASAMISTGEMVPPAGIEPATFGLQNRCSTS